MCIPSSSGGHVSISDRITLTNPTFKELWRSRWPVKQTSDADPEQMLSSMERRTCCTTPDFFIWFVFIQSSSKHPWERLDPLLAGAGKLSKFYRI